MRRYWLFSGGEFESEGGMNDFVGSFNTVSEAIDEFNIIKEVDSWYHIFDSYKKEVTHEYRSNGLYNLNAALKEDML